MSDIFEHAVAYVANAGNFMPLAAAARASGVTGLALKLWDTGDDPDVTANQAMLAGPDAARLHGLGFKLGGWACPRTQPGRCASELSVLYGKYGLSFVVFECEAEYKTDGGGVDVATLLSPWRRMRPLAYTGIATEGMVPATFNHHAAIAARCRYLPESYYRVDGRYDASAELRQAVALGWPVSWVHPTLSGVEGHTIAESMLRAYRARSSGFTHGVAVWRGDMLRLEDYVTLALGRGELFL